MQRQNYNQCGASRAKRKSSLLTFLAAAVLAGSGSTAMAATATYDFATDPQFDPELNLIVRGNNIQPWQETGGNDGGFLAVTYPVNSQNTTVIFPDIDPGKIVTGFRFEADLRVGNSVGDRAADGFSISFARAGDPVLENPDDINAFAVPGAPENGTQTGIVVSFDTWSGNMLPDGRDFPDNGAIDDPGGIIVRVDNQTVLRQSLPLYHGECDDPNSLQTGPRDPAYWAASGDPYAPESWETLCWQPFVMELDEDGKLTVTWKGQTILDQFQTDYFPTAGQLVLAGRTGGANEHTHFDNIQLTTVAVEGGEPPTVPANLQATSIGARRVALDWEPSTHEGGRVQYEVERDGVKISTGLLTQDSFVDQNAPPGTEVTYQVRALNVAGTPSDYATLTITTAEEITTQGWVKGEIFDDITGTEVWTLIEDPEFVAGTPDRVVYLNGISFGETTGFGDTFGSNFGIRISGTLTVPETGEYDFFLRSDDASQFYLNTSGSALPDPASGVEIPLMEETGCCAAFQEPGDPRTSWEPVSLTAGQQYGFVFLVKEGGGGDWGQVAMRMVGDTTPAASLQPIRGPLVTGTVDPVGADITITEQPESQTITANESATLTVGATHVSPYGAPLVYQWYRNNQIISGETGSTLTIPVVTTDDNNAVYKAWVGTLGANEFSSEATLTVQEDTLAPSIVSLTPDDTFTSVEVEFSEPVASPSATTAANFTLSGGATVSAVERVDEFTVRLTTSQLAEDTEYTLNIANVEDNAGNPVAANTSGTFRSWKLIANRVQLLRYHGIEGTAVSLLLEDPSYPDEPDAIVYRTGMSFGEETNFGNTYGDNFGAVLRGWLIPEESGEYHFFIRSDDASQLFLSTDATLPDPLTDFPIAEETGCCEGFKEPGTAQPFETTTDPITLTAGQRYGMVFVVKEGGGGDWGQVAMRMVGDTTPAGSLPFLSDQVYYFGPATGGGGEGGELDVSRSGDTITITWTSGTLESAPTVTGPWEQVEGATGGTYTTTATGDARFFRTSE